MRTPGHTTVIAYASLFVALGGTGYAATSLAPNSVGSSQVKNGSLQSRDLARGVLSKRNARLADAITQVITDPATGVELHITATDGKDGAPGPMGPQGPQGDNSQIPGPQGDQGPQGVRGEALAYAHVFDNGTVDAAHSTPNAVVTKAAGFSGLYCIDAKGATVRNVVATIDANAPLSARALSRVAVAGGGCDGHDFEILTVNNNTATDEPFYATLN